MKWEQVIIDGEEYHYEVSNTGLVRNVETNKILKGSKDSNGYLRVNLCKNGKPKTMSIHRLVLIAFKSQEYFDGAEVDHINTIPHDNRLENLRWCSREENCRNELTKKHHKNNKNAKGKLIERWSRDGKTLIDIKYNFEYTDMGFNKNCISDCCNGRQRTHKGFKFKFHN